MLIRPLLGDPSTFAREMDRLFDSMATSSRAAGPGVFRPAVNMWETDDTLHVEAELPGLAMDDIEILATGEAMTIKGTRTASSPVNAETLRRERATGTFERTITLPVPIDVDSIAATLRNGVLAITLPKAAAYQPRRIEVRSGHAP